MRSGNNVIRGETARLSRGSCIILKDTCADRRPERDSPIVRIRGGAIMGVTMGVGGRVRRAAGLAT